MLLVTNSPNEEKEDNKDKKIGRSISPEEAIATAQSIVDEEEANTDQEKWAVRCNHSISELVAQNIDNEALKKNTKEEPVPARKPKLKTINSIEDTAHDFPQFPSFNYVKHHKGDQPIPFKEEAEQQVIVRVRSFF